MRAEEDDAAVLDCVLGALANRHRRKIACVLGLQPRPGGRFRFEVVPGQFCERQYAVVDRPVRLVFTWGWTDPGFGLAPGTSRVEVTLTRVGEDGQQTRLRLVHTGLGGDLGLLHEDGWSRFLGRLAAVTGGGDPAPYPGGEPAGRLTVLRGQRDGTGSS
jgi:Activator of Hsp90 ATPase homolog 1-like protein